MYIKDLVVDLIVVLLSKRGRILNINELLVEGRIVCLGSVG